MPTKIQADYDTLANLSGIFTHHADIYNETTSSLTRYVDAVLAGGWVGSGADNFCAEMHDVVLPATRRLVDALGQAHDSLTQISSLIRAAEETAAGLFKHGQDSGLLAMPTPDMESPVGEPIWLRSSIELSMLANLLGDAFPDWWVKTMLPVGTLAIRMEPAGQSLIDEATKDGVCFVMPNGDTLGDPNGKQIHIVVGHLDGAIGVYDANTQTITLSNDLMGHPNSPIDIADTLSHEMQHALDRQEGRMPKDLDSAVLFDVKNREDTLSAYIQAQVDTEVRAHRRGYAVRWGNAYVDDGTTSADEAKYIIEQRGYDKYYEDYLNKAYKQAYEQDPSVGKHTVDVYVDSAGKVRVTVN